MLPLLDYTYNVAVKLVMQDDKFDQLTKKLFNFRKPFIITIIHYYYAVSNRCYINNIVYI